MVLVQPDQRGRFGDKNQLVKVCIEFKHCSLAVAFHINISKFQFLFISLTITELYDIYHTAVFDHNIFQVLRSTRSSLQVALL